jgi:hypothetical protein
VKGPLLAAGAVVVYLAAAFVALAGVGDRETDKFTAADQAIAQATVARRTDLGAGDWRGGTIKPNLKPLKSCPNFHPKLSDLVRTGAAASDWKRGGLELRSQAELYDTPRMLRLAWQRKLADPDRVPCARRQIVNALPSGWRLVSLERITLPRIAPYQFAVRSSFESTSSGQTSQRLRAESIVVGKGRVVISVEAFAEGGVTQQMASAAGLRVARILVARVNE